jgi:hypothetical protein
MIESTHLQETALLESVNIKSNKKGAIRVIYNLFLSVFSEFLCVWNCLKQCIPTVKHQITAYISLFFQQGMIGTSYGERGVCQTLDNFPLKHLPSLAKILPLTNFQNFSDDH